MCNVHSKKSFKIHETKTDRTEQGIENFTINSCKFKHSILSNWENKQTEISKDVGDINNFITHLDLIEIQAALKQTKEEYIFFSSAHETYININNVLSNINFQHIYKD